MDRTEDSEAAWRGLAWTALLGAWPGQHYSGQGRAGQGGAGEGRLRARWLQSLLQLQLQPARQAGRESTQRIDQVPRIGRSWSGGGWGAVLMSV